MIQHILQWLQERRKTEVLARELLCKEYDARVRLISDRDAQEYIKARGTRTPDGVDIPTVMLDGKAWDVVAFSVDVCSDGQTSMRIEAIKCSE